MFFHPEKKYIYLLVLFTFLSGQTKNSRSYFQSDNYVLGGFMNISDGALDFECLANIQSDYGIYGNIWLSQIDYYSNTDIQSNISLGFNKKFDSGFSLDLGYAHNYSFSEEPEQVPELFIGADINNVSVWTFVGDSGISFESWFKPDLDILNESNLDLLLYGFAEKNGYDLSINISNQLTDLLIVGMMLGYENYSEENKFTYNKNNNKKSITITNNYSGISSMIYLGFLFNH